MSPTTLRRRSTAALIAALALALGACSTDSSEEQPETTTATDTEETADSGEWPRTVEHDAGTTEIPEKPLVIVSTSLTITGTLLAMDAPVVATAATSPGPVTDENGFFSQWADVAVERGVEVLYPNLELDLEAVEVAEPDLIIGSTIGADSTLEAYDQLSEIAPTVLFDYGSYSWQELAEKLAEATGLEDGTEALIADYDGWIAEQAAALSLPEQPVSAVSYNGADDSAIFSGTSAQADLLTSLGFTYQAADPQYDVNQGSRADTAFVTAENLPAALGDSQTIFLISADDSVVADFVSDPLLANQPAVANDRVHTLGLDSFRIDYYSARNIAGVLVGLYGE